MEVEVEVETDTDDVMEVEVQFEFYQAQYDYFYLDRTKYNLNTKGRRIGFTAGAALYCMIEMIENAFQFLWVDTIYSNIDRYVDRYFMPFLRSTLPVDDWDWNKQKKILKIYDSVLDFRSADRPQSIEGFGYHRIIINEAGLVLKGTSGKYLWYNVIIPMTMDYPNVKVFVGGTPKGQLNKDNSRTVYYELYLKATEENNPLYTQVNIATDENPFLTDEAVQEVKDELPEGVIRDQEFYGLFVTRSEGIIKSGWFTIDEEELDSVEDVRHWDLAFTDKKTSDSSAGALLGATEEKTQIKDIIVAKLHWNDLKNLIMDTAELDGPDVTVVLEEAGQQIALVEDLQVEPRMRNFTVKGQAPKGNKLIRCMKWASRLERGIVTLLRGAWNRPFINESTAFTNDDSHAADDQIDAVSGGYQYKHSAKSQNKISHI